MIYIRLHQTIKNEENESDHMYYKMAEIEDFMMKNRCICHITLANIRF